MRCPHCGNDFEPDKRSNAQNRRAWARIVRGAQEILSQKTVLPLSKEQTWDVLKTAFLGEVDTPLGRAPMDSKDLPPKEFAELCDRIEAYFATEYGVSFDNVPDEDVA